MTHEDIYNQILQKKSFLCVGLDSEYEKIPLFLKKYANPVLEFNKQIIDATKDFCVSYKINTAFYEKMGILGWQTLEETLKYIPDNKFTIADAKRGDIGNTSKNYAEAFLKNLNFDSITVAPYMGRDSISPFLENKDKWAIVLALTSNQGAFDFQTLKLENGKYLYEEVIEKSKSWGDNIMYVVGATKADKIKSIRALVPNHFLLVPGVGAQGGSLEEVAINGMNEKVGILINSSRDIIFADNTEKFAEKARENAKKIQEKMSIILDKYLKT